MIVITSDNLWIPGNFVKTEQDRRVPGAVELILQFIKKESWSIAIS